MPVFYALLEDVNPNALARLNRAFFELFERIEVACFLRENSAIPVYESGFMPINDDGQDEDPVPIFNLTQSSLNQIFENPQVTISYIMRKYYENNDIMLQGEINPSYTIKIFRKCPFQWERFSLLNLPAIRQTSGSQVSFVETNENSEENLRPEETARYNKILMRNIMMGVMMAHIKLQTHSLGFYRPPHHINPMPPNFPMWFENFSWLEQMSLNPVTWTRLNNSSSLSIIRTVIGEIRSSAIRYYEGAKLDDHTYWINDRREPYTYVSHLKTFQCIMNKCFKISYNCLEHSLTALNAAQQDLVSVLETVIKR